MRDCRVLVEETIRKNPFLPVSGVVVEVLRQLIIDCEAVPGERLKEKDLAESMGVSRTTVRSAFDTLMQEGLLERKERQGVFVTGLSKIKYIKIAELRVMLDSFSGKLAAKRRSESDLAEMRRQVEALHETADVADYARADMAFHDAVYHASKNEYIPAVYQAIRVDLARMKIFGSPKLIGEKDRVYKEHVKILRAIENRDDHAAYEACLSHAKIMLDPGIMLDTFGED